MAGPRAEVGIFGGSGLYELLGDVEQVDVDTPFGAPSAPLRVGTVGRRRVAFLPRHGPNHEHPAHRVNYRANVWAMKEVGVEAVLAPFTCGSLQPDIEPGHFVVVDQFVDRTTGRSDTVFDGGGAHHTAMAEPYAPAVRRLLVDAVRANDVTAHDGGTVVVIQGPRFSTRAESRWFSSMGWHVVNMTQYPEAALANELELPYGAVGLVTDFDAGLEDRPDVPHVTMEQVFAFFQANVERVRGVLFRAIADLA
jgi:5'-methylthioadenosine phosphorylase